MPDSVMGQLSGDSHEGEMPLQDKKDFNIDEDSVEIQNLNWKKIGNLTFHGYDSTRLDGLRPVFRLENKDNADLLVTQKKFSKVCIIKQLALGENSQKFVDEPNIQPQLATLVEDETLHIGQHKVVVKLEDGNHPNHEQTFFRGEVFRFQSAHAEKIKIDSKEEKQMDAPLDKDTASTTKAVKKPQLMDLVDSFAIKAGSPSLKDRGASKFHLNNKQYEAYKMALNKERQLVCIQGPPGSGKTQLLSIVLADLIFKKEQGIVLTASKESLKTIREMTERMSKKINVKLDKNTLMDDVTFDKVVGDSESAKTASKQVAEWQMKAARGEITLKEFNAWSKDCLSRMNETEGNVVMDQVRIVFATTQSRFAQDSMKFEKFNPVMCVIDDASQAAETLAWPAKTKIQRIVMAGDPDQWNASFQSTEDFKEAKVEESIMNRVIDNKEKFHWILFKDQYRCHPDIYRWSNNKFYCGQIENQTYEQDTIRRKFKTSPRNAFLRLFDPFVIVDTSSEFDKDKRRLFYERRPDDELLTDKNFDSIADSFVNPGEARLAMIHYQHLRQFGIPAENIAFLTPYSGQVELIKKEIKKYRDITQDEESTRTTIGTVNKVIGQEFDCVIFSMVRSNPKKAMGFSKNYHRLNVAMTRAKYHLMFIGNGFLMSENRETCYLFKLLCDAKHRFHPQKVEFINIEPGHIVTNNFGYNFTDFVENSNDEYMKGWCRKYVENQKNPRHKENQEKKRVDRPEEDLAARRNQ